MHANASGGGGGGSGGSWRIPQDETLQVQDPKEKLDVSNGPRPPLPTEMKNENVNLQEFDYDETHNWKSIIFSLLVIGFVIAGIVTAIYLLG